MLDQHSCIVCDQYELPLYHTNLLTCSCSPDGSYWKCAMQFIHIIKTRIFGSRYALLSSWCIPVYYRIWDVDFQKINFKNMTSCEARLVSLTWFVYNKKKVMKELIIFLAWICFWFNCHFLTHHSFIHSISLTHTSHSLLVSRNYCWERKLSYWFWILKAIAKAHYSEHIWITLGMIWKEVGNLFDPYLFDLHLLDLHLFDLHVNCYHR